MAALQKKVAAGLGPSMVDGMNALHLECQGSRGPRNSVNPFGFAECLSFEKIVLPPGTRTSMFGRHTTFARGQKLIQTSQICGPFRPSRRHQILKFRLPLNVVYKQSLDILNFPDVAGSCCSSSATCFAMQRQFQDFGV